MPDNPCPHCGTALAEPVRFCTGCGAPQNRNEPSQPGTRRREAAGVLLEAEPKLVHCRLCEASNAASRERCGRCGADLRTGDQPAKPGRSGDPPPPVERDTSTAFTVVVALAGLAIVGVLAALLAARGGGPFGGTDSDEADGPLAVPIVAVQASSGLPRTPELSFEPENIVDGDERTAWVSAAGEDEWIELRLADARPVTRIVLWNGYQRDDWFAEYGRIRGMRIVVGEMRLSADVLDVEGPQAIDLPEPIATDELRLEITDQRAGSRYPQVALSGVEVLATTDG